MAGLWLHVGTDTNKHHSSTLPGLYLTFSLTSVPSRIAAFSTLPEVLNTQESPSP